MTSEPDLIPTTQKPAPTRPRKLLRILSLLLLVLLLAGSLIANVVLYRQADSNYRQLCETQLDPYGLKHPSFVDSPRSGPTSKPIAVFYGDSRAKAWPAPQFPALQFLHRGIGGQSTEQIRGRIDAHLLALSPRVVILQAGINDLKTIALFPDRRDDIVATCKSNLREIISRATAGGATVIVTTIFPPGDVPLERRPIWSPAIEPAVEDVNADLRTLASDKVIVFDAWKLLEQNSKLRDGLGLDTLHLNEKGYELLNAKLTETLNSAIKQ